MSNQPDRIYFGFTIAVQIHTMHSNRYGSSFSVHQGADGTPAHQLPLVYKESAELGMSCFTEDDASQDALERAQEWINAQLSPDQSEGPVV